MKKGILIGILVVVLGCTGLAGGIAYWVIQLTQGPADAATQFFTLLGEGKIDQAHAAAASLLRKEHDPAKFADLVKRLGLADTASVSWPNRSVVNNEATLKGTVTTRGGGTIPVTVQMVYEGEQWRVLHVSISEAGIQAGGKPALPEDDELRRLATDTLIDFDQAIRDKDFTAFHGKISKLWQAEINAGKLLEIFQVFIDRKVDLSAVLTVAPEFNQPPAIDEKGLLTLAGYVPDKSLRIDFKLRYVYEHPDWKLISIEVNANPQKPPE